MMIYKEVEGDLIKLALEGNFDVIAHGCNCFCTMGAGIAPQMAKAFGADSFKKERLSHKGDINKLGTIDYESKWFPKPTEIGANFGGFTVHVVNAYTQYGFGANHATGSPAPIDYEALTLCLRKINHIFKGKRIGLPQIGCGLAGGKWSIVSKLIQAELFDCDVTVVIFKK